MVVANMKFYIDSNNCICQRGIQIKSEYLFGNIYSYNVLLALFHQELIIKK